MDRATDCEENGRAVIQFEYPEDRAFFERRLVDEAESLDDYAAMFDFR